MNKKSQASNRDTTVQQDSDSDTEEKIVPLFAHVGQTEQPIAACALSTLESTIANQRLIIVTCIQ